ncbi:hypothetical protein DXG01_006914 [Tephrocybe rancida]|nr:hypothetical protein DXG01_006914 [Tephrocybe rancida]
MKSYNFYAAIEYQVKALTVENKRLQMSFETNVSAYRNLNGLYESEHNRLQDTINDLRDKYLKLESENQKLRVELDTAEKEKKEAEEAKKVAEETIEHNRRWGLELAERNRVWLLECETFWKTKLSEAEQRAKNTEEHFKRKLKELNSVIWQTRNENDDLRREIRRWAPAAWFAGNARSTVAAASGLASWW